MATLHFQPIMQNKKPRSVFDPYNFSTARYRPELNSWAEKAAMTPGCFIAAAKDTFVELVLKSDLNTDNLFLFIINEFAFLRK